jgi:GlpG protein
MSAVPVLRLPLAVDLSGFVKLLQRMQVPHRVSEEAGEQVLWVPETISDDVRVLYERFPPVTRSATGHPEQAPVSRPSFIQQVRRSPVTALVLLASLIVGAVTLLGENLQP